MSDATAKTRRLVKWLLWGFGSVVGLLLAAWIGFSVVGARQLADAIEELRKGDYATSLADMAPPPIPPEKNGAAEFLAAFALHPDPGQENGALTKAREEGFAALSEEERFSLRRLLDEATPFFGKIREGRAKGGARFARDYARGLAMDMPDLAHVVGAASLLHVGAQTQSTMEASETVRDILALAEAYREDPLLVCQLVRFVILGSVVETIDRLVTPETSEAELRAWLDILPAPDIVDGATERAFRGEMAQATQLALRPTEALGADGKAFDRDLLLSPWWKLSCARYLRSMRRQIETARKPFLESRAELEGYSKQLRDNRNFLDFFSMLLMPSTARALDQFEITRTSLALVRAGLAAEIERATSGRYPEKCSAVDPLSAKPFLLEQGKLRSAGLWDRPQVVEEYRLTWTLRKK